MDSVFLIVTVYYSFLIHIPKFELLSNHAVQTSWLFLCRASFCVLAFYSNMSHYLKDECFYNRDRAKSNYQRILQFFIKKNKIRMTFYRIIAFPTCYIVFFKNFIRANSVDLLLFERALLIMSERFLLSNTSAIILAPTHFLQCSKNITLNNKAVIQG